MTTPAEAVLEAEPYLPLAEAAKLAGVRVETLLDHIRQGTVHAVRVDGVIAVRQEDAAQLTPKEQLPEYKKHAHLRGIPIGLKAAATKYGIPHQTVSRWVRLGYIRCLGREGRKTLIDQADIAYCAEVYRKRGGQGRWLFNRDGTPYIPKTVSQ